MLVTFRRDPAQSPGVLAAFLFVCGAAAATFFVALAYSPFYDVLDPYVGATGSNFYFFCLVLACILWRKNRAKLLLTCELYMVFSILIGVWEWWAQGPGAQPRPGREVEAHWPVLSVLIPLLCIVALTLTYGFPRITKERMVATPPAAATAGQRPLDA